MVVRTPLLRATQQVSGWCQSSKQVSIICHSGVTVISNISKQIHLIGKRFNLLATFLVRYVINYLFQGPAKNSSV